MSFKENATFKQTKFKLVPGTLEVTGNKFIFSKESKMVWIITIIPALIFGIIGSLFGGFVGLIIGAFAGAAIGGFSSVKLKEKNSSFQASKIITEFNINTIKKVELKKHGANYLHTFSTTNGEFSFYYKKENILAEYKEIIERTSNKDVELSENILIVKS